MIIYCQAMGAEVCEGMQRENMSQLVVTERPFSEGSYRTQQFDWIADSCHGVTVLGCEKVALWTSYEKTIHRAKGLVFQMQYILDSTGLIWGNEAKAV